MVDDAVEAISAAQIGIVLARLTEEVTHARDDSSEGRKAAGREQSP